MIFGPTIEGKEGIKRKDEEKNCNFPSRTSLDETLETKILSVTPRVPISNEIIKRIIIAGNVSPGIKTKDEGEGEGGVEHERRIQYQL